MSFRKARPLNIKLRPSLLLTLLIFYWTYFCGGLLRFCRGMKAIKLVVYFLIVRMLLTVCVRQPCQEIDKNTLKFSKELLQLYFRMSVRKARPLNIKLRPSIVFTRIISYWTYFCGDLLRFCRGMKAIKLVVYFLIIRLQLTVCVRQPCQEIEKKYIRIFKRTAITLFQDELQRSKTPKYKAGTFYTLHSLNF